MCQDAAGEREEIADQYQSVQRLTELMKGGLIRQIEWKHLCGRTTGERGLSSLKLRDANVPILVIEVFQSQQSVSWQQYRVIDGFELLLHWRNGGDSTKNICCPSKFALCDSTKLNAHILNYPRLSALSRCWPPQTAVGEHHILPQKTPRNGLHHLRQRWLTRRTHDALHACQNWVCSSPPFDIFLLIF